MKIAVAGGTGFLGKALTKALHARGHSVTVLTRASRSGSPINSFIVWSPAKPGGLEMVLSGYDAFVNLGGESIAAGRWTPERRQALVESRLLTTKALVEIMSRCAKKPRVFVSASAVGYYGPRGDESLTEKSPPGAGFLAGLTQKWEEAAQKAQGLGLRLVIFRLGVVLGKGGGALPEFARPFKFFAGGPLGSGEQWMSWIHIDDFTGLVVTALEREKWQGTYNATAPKPVRNRQFAKTLGKVMWRPSFLRLPAGVLKAVAGPMADEMILAGQKVIPEKATKAGYEFKFPGLEGALRTLV